MRKILAALFVIGFFVVGHWALVFAESCSTSCSNDNLDKCMAECQKLINISISSTKPHEQTAQTLEKEILDIDNNITALGVLIDKKKTIITADEQKFSSRQKILNTQVRDFYKKNWSSSLEYFLATVFEGSNAGDAVNALAYRQNLMNKDKQTITSLVLELSDLQKQKKDLEDNQNWLAAKQISLATTLAPIKKLVADARAYQSQLNQTAGVLSSRQQQLLAEKTGNFSTSVGDVPDALDSDSSIEGFRNNAPSGSFAGFSFGAPHRKGMSQYGAYGRAKSGQNAETILHAYYGNIEIKKDYSTGININVQGFGSYNIEDYVKRIYEEPNSWGDNGGYEALKAQAVAARSYALAYTGNGSGSICATESCQVFQSNPKGGNWERAVNDTRGWVMVSGGQPFSAWYAASSGGYNTPGGWDTKCGNQSCWTADAYEKIGGSPWFYKAWYKPRYSSATRSNAWLSKDEFVDIVNAVLLYQKDHNNISHLSQTDKSNSDTWSRDEVRNRLGGDAISDVSDVSVNYSTGGYTNTVVINGRSIDGGDFRQIFNIRAPGEIWLASSLFNIEKK